MQVIASALDAGGYVDDRSRVAALMQALEKEFPELALASFPRGIVARCYLGEPYEVHTLDLVLGQIITHYKRGQGLPDGLERARSLALHPDYAFVEVYADELRPVRADGAVTVVNAGSSEGL
ncbi:MAG TPA: hypothetical protein VMD91_09430 [Candidatus Sulfotelmatobacter sp.]|nr:hypothetical protein [Candidatus Sulfotelmatobacter sp.]